MQRVEVCPCKPVSGYVQKEVNHRADGIEGDSVGHFCKLWQVVDFAWPWVEGYVLCDVSFERAFKSYFHFHEKFKLAVAAVPLCL